MKWFLMKNGFIEKWLYCRQIFFIFSKLDFHKESFYYAFITRITIQIKFKDYGTLIGTKGMKSPSWQESWHILILIYCLLLESSKGGKLKNPNKISSLIQPLCLFIKIPVIKQFLNKNCTLLVKNFMSKFKRLWLLKRSLSRISW